MDDFDKIMILNGQSETEAYNDILRNPERQKELLEFYGPEYFHTLIRKAFRYSTIGHTVWEKNKPTE